jgi:hypothetical protein
MVFITSKLMVDGCGFDGRRLAIVGFNGELTVSDVGERRKLVGSSLQSHLASRQTKDMFI